MPKKKPEPAQPQLADIARSAATRRSMDDHEPTSASLSFTIETLDDPETGKPTPYGRFSRNWQDEETPISLVIASEARQSTAPRQTMDRFVRRPCKIHFKPAPSADLSFAAGYGRRFRPISQTSRSNRSPAAGTTKGPGLS